MGKEILIFSIAFFLLFINAVFLYIGIETGSEVEEMSVSSLFSGNSIFKLGDMLFSLPPLLTIFFIALNVMGIAMIIMILRGV